MLYDLTDIVSFSVKDLSDWFKRFLKNDSLRDKLIKVICHESELFETLKIHTKDMVKLCEWSKKNTAKKYSLIYSVTTQILTSIIKLTQGLSIYLNLFESNCIYRPITEIQQRFEASGDLVSLMCSSKTK